MTTYEYAKLYLQTSDENPTRVASTDGIPFADGSVQDMTAVDALNRLGMRGWRPLQVEDYSERSIGVQAEVWHLVRSSDDNPHLRSEG